MRFNVLVLAINLFGADSVLAGPCKPRSSSSSEVATASTTTVAEPTTSTIGIISDESSETTTWELTTSTSVVEASSGTTTFETTTTTLVTEVSSDTSAPKTTATTAIVETTATSDAYTTTITTTDAQTTPNIIATTTTPGDETTTTAAEAMTTFEIVGGGGAVNGAVLKGRGDGTTELMFNPTYQGFLGRAYTIDPTNGRVQDQGTGKYVCAYYAVTGRAEPATISACIGNPDLDPGSSYLNCRVVRGKLSCQVPQVVCERDLMNPFAGAVCQTSSSNEVYDRTFYATAGDRVIALGKSSPDSFWEAVDLLAHGVPGI